MSVSKMSCPNCGGVACLIRRAEPVATIVGAASGGAAGNSVGKVVDESVVGQYRCIKCDHTFKV